MYIYNIYTIYTLVIPGQTAEPNWMIFWETHGSTQAKQYHFFFFFFKVIFFHSYGNTAGTPSATYPENIDDLNIIDKRGEREVTELLDILENIDDDLDRLGISMVKV